MKTRTPSVIVRCVCLLLVLGLNCNTPVSGRRILNGRVADPALYPFLVHLTMFRKHREEVCGGTVISNHFILTAAHCIIDVSCEEIEIGPSTFQLGDDATYYGHECYPHFDYISGNFDHDIGLIETKEDLLQNPDITQQNLPIPETTYNRDTPAVIVGWGRTEEDLNPNGVLHADVHVSEWDSCNDEFKTAPSCDNDMDCPPPDIPEHSFCTLGDHPNPPGTCVGDSGGPVIIDDTVAGVVSGVILDHNLCEVGTPSLHTLVSQYVPWIMTIADLARRAKRSTDMKNATIAKPLRNYTSRAGLYQ